MKIQITSHKDAFSVAKKISPTHIISITDPGTESPFKNGFGNSSILHLSFLDITDPIVASKDKNIAPSEDIIRQIYNFGKTFETDSIILCHCYFGISRSSAAGIISLTPGHGGLGATRMVGSLKIGSVDGWNFFQPNGLMISIFDGLIGFDGDLEDLIAQRFVSKN